MQIFDCFTFFNELELLDLRLMVLYDYVDHFVLVEANKTHTGKPKEFIFEQNKDMFYDYLDKIIYIKVEDLPDYSRDNIWLAENFQRMCINRGLTKANKGDKIIVSDVDEIPNPQTIMQHLDSTDQVSMAHKLFYYYVNCIQQQIWTGSYMATYGNYDSLQRLREVSLGRTDAVPDGGWHYSYMGGPAKVKLKVENIAESHVIIGNVGGIEEIERKMSTQQDLWGRQDPSFRKQIVNIFEYGMAPKCIGEFIKKYPDFYYGG